MRCQANKNGSYVECELGNPMKRNTKVRAGSNSQLLMKEFILLSLILICLCVRNDKLIARL